MSVIACFLLFSLCLVLAAGAGVAESSGLLSSGRATLWLLAFGIAFGVAGIFVLIKEERNYRADREHE